VAERHDRVLVAGELGDQADLDPLSLQRRDEGMPCAMGRDRGQPEALERWGPITLAEVPVDQRAAAAEPRQRPGASDARRGEYALKLAVPPRAPDALREQHLAQERRHRDRANARRGLGELGERTVAHLNTPDAYDVRLEVDVVP
jgi:hypothetical protein